MWLKAQESVVSPVGYVGGSRPFLIFHYCQVSEGVMLGGQSPHVTLLKT